MTPRPAIFLDRDGTLNVPVVREGRPYPPATVEEFKLFDDVAAACAELKSAGYLLVVVTNQPDVGRGIQSREIVEKINARLLEMVPQIDNIKVCYHGGEKFNQPCDCRKPLPGMILKSSKHLGIDLSKSWMIGDRWRDIDSGNAAGCRTIFINHGYQEELKTSPDFTVNSFAEITGIILAQK